MKKTFGMASGLVFSVFLLFSSLAFSEGTSLWKQSQYDEFEKGTSKGVALTSDGRLELAPSFKQVFISPSTYIWQVVSDFQGNAYLAGGSPARVYRVTPDGKASIIFEARELQVQSLQIDQDGVLYAATSPDGKVYKITRAGTAGPEDKKPSANAEGGEAQPNSNRTPLEATAARSEVPVDSSYRSSVFFDPKTKYIWDLALDPESGRLYIATGDRGEIYKVEKDGGGSLFFTSDESNIRSLAIQPVARVVEENPGRRTKNSKKTGVPLRQSNLIAGSDGSGLIYRISPAGEAFVLYSANKKEITALAVDDAGAIYAAGVGDKKSQGATGVPLPLTLAQNSTQGNAGTGAAQPNANFQVMNPAPGGSEIYAIAPDGTPRLLWSSRDDLVYALALNGNSLLVGTGNRGHVFAIGRNAHAGSFTDLLKASANQVSSFARNPNGTLYASTSNLGKLFMIGANPEPEGGSFESDVFDARIFSRWGRPEVRGTGSFDLYARSGNVDNPDRNWSPWNKVDWTRDATLGVPDSRFMQWKVTLHPGNPPATISSVGINYRSKNVAPVVDDVTVQVGARFGAGMNGKAGGEPVMVGFSGTGATTQNGNPVPAIRDHDSIAVRWAAHDDNDDELAYSVYYRGDGETNWRLLKDNIREKQYSWDASLLPDGGYVVKVVASDAPSHTPDEALTDEKESARFEVDSTPPRVEALLAKMDGQELHVTFRAIDSFSPIKRAEYSVDAGDWQVVEPVGRISDSREENYDFNILLPAGDAGAVSPQQESRKKFHAPSGQNAAGGGTAGNEHLIVVRVYDRFDNMSSAKTLTGVR